MTEFNKGDIVYPTAEYQEQNAGWVAEDDGIPDDRDKYLAEGKPFRVVGFTDPIPSPLPALFPSLPGLVVSVPVDSERMTITSAELLADPSELADVFLFLPNEIEYAGGVLAGV